MDIPINIDSKWLYAQQVEKEIKNELDISKGFPLIEHINDLMQELRNTAQETIFLDFRYAVDHGVEGRLWGVHTLMKDRHKKLVNAALKKEPRNLVEVRKLQKHYADFIKKSQFFYRGYIQRLASTYCGLKGLRRIAHCLSLETLSAENLIQVSPELEHLIDASCHATLLRLGDLSRYRNEIRVKDRSWEPALGYYSLAGNLCPDSGSSHHQIAVVALADQDHLDALYHLHRAIAINEPYPMAKSNLEIEFKKILAAWEKKPVPHAKLSNEATLTLWFVRLQSKFYKGADFVGNTHQELEDEVLSRLTRLLREQSFETTLEKIVITSIAAEYLAAERLHDSSLSSDTMKSFQFLLRFNIRTIIALLQTLQPELVDTVSGEELPSHIDGSQPIQSREKITAVARRVLPVLRQYSTWLVAKSSVIAQAAHTDLGPYIRQLWIIYADVMTKITGIFPVEDLDTVGYLLEEDEMTVGFKPLRVPELTAESNLYVDEDGMMKPRFTDPGIERSHPNIEMVARIRDILLCALTLYAEQKAPITLDNMKFVFVEGMSLASHAPILSVGSPPDPASNYATSPSVKKKSPGLTSYHTATTCDSYQGMETDMHRMVDSLLGPSSERHAASNETSYGMHSLTANDIFAPMASSGVQAPHQITPKMLPSLPGIWNSPFTPQPHELQPNSPERPLNGRQLSPFQLSTSEQQFAAATALDKMTGYGRSAIGSLGKSSRPSNVLLQSVSHTSQESLPQQFMPMTAASSDFTDSSSIYANTPRVEHCHSGIGLRGAPYAATNGYNTTTYAGASDFDRTTMLQSSIWEGSQAVIRGGYISTPPAGQPPG